MTIHAKHYATGRPIAVDVEGDRIRSVAHSDRNPTHWVAPAFFDPQINGCLGIAFNSTFVALIASIILMFVIHELQLRQERLVLDTEMYVDDALLSNLQSR